MIDPTDAEGPREITQIGRRALDRLRRAKRLPAERPQHAAFDPVRAEAEFYDAIYGPRTGTVENIAPVDAAAARSRRRRSPA